MAIRISGSIDSVNIFLYCLSIWELPDCFRYSSNCSPITLNGYGLQPPLDEQKLLKISEYSPLHSNSAQKITIKNGRTIKCADPIAQLRLRLANRNWILSQFYCFVKELA